MHHKLIDVVYCRNEEIANDLFETFISKGYAVCKSSQQITTGTDGDIVVKRLDLFEGEKKLTSMKNVSEIREELVSVEQAISRNKNEYEIGNLGGDELDERLVVYETKLKTLKWILGET